MPSDDVTMGLAQRQAYANGVADQKRKRPDFRTIERELVEFFRGQDANLSEYGDVSLSAASGRSKEDVSLTELARRLADLFGKDS